MRNSISSATQRNWDRLSPDMRDRLKSRANKSKSTKKIIPSEYISDVRTLDFITNVIELQQEYTISDIIYTVAHSMLVKSGINKRKNIVGIIDSYIQDTRAIKIKLDFEVPKFSLEEDIIGAVYQSLLAEGDKNKNGSYYTPKNIVRDMVSEIELDKQSKILDPCCGSGAFLLEIEVDDPRQLYGIELDRHASFIASINLLLKYREIDFIPNIKNSDFLFDEELFGKDISFDIIITNPPWGSKAKVVTNRFSSKESFSQFFVKSYSIIDPFGTISFLFPESILNVKTHKDIRQFIIKHNDLHEIQCYNSSFTGVLTKAVSMKFVKSLKTSKILVKKNNEEYDVSYTSFEKTANKVFSLLNSKEESIIEHVLSKANYTLEDSVWALGIVTGSNKEKVLQKSAPGLEKIYTGKEIEKYKLKDAQNYILYDRPNFQQVAKDEIYRAKEKLVYKFVSSKLMFAYDDTSSLFLNSANILIPNVPGMSTKTVMAFLNSKLYQFLYEKLFGELKVLRGNLSQLPFPAIDPEINIKISQMVDRIRNGEDALQEKIDKIIFDIFDIDKNAQKYIH